jgi:hypothetical protein
MADRDQHIYMLAVLDVGCQPDMELFKPIAGRITSFIGG